MRDHGACRTRQLGVEPEPTPSVCVPILEPTITLGAERLVLDVLTRPEVADPADSAGGDTLRPTHEGVLVVELGEPGELDHLVDAELAPFEGVGRGRKCL